MGRTTTLVLLVIYLTGFTILYVESTCKIPDEYSGKWYHRDDGDDTEILITPEKWDGRNCYVIYKHPIENGTNLQASTILLKSDGVENYKCYDVIYRSDYILQVRSSGEFTNPNIKDCPGMKKLPNKDEVYTMFKFATPTLNCIASLEGIFHFTYEVGSSGGGICDHPDNHIDACQVPGSQNYDNMAFMMSFKKCPDIDNSFDRVARYQCMGRWDTKVGNTEYTFIALTDMVASVLQDKFRCLLTQRDQRSEDNTISWGMSRFGDCRHLRTLFDSPTRLVLTRVPPMTEYDVPRCTLPRNLTGTWYTQGIQFASKVWINETHMHYTTQRSRYDYEETLFSCQAGPLGTRYLMTKSVVGRCEVNFVCIDLVPRHHGIVRYRVGRPLKLSAKKENVNLPNEDFITSAFREACSWQWLTLARDNADWKYEVLIQDPPSPVMCPIGGRYHFKQTSDDFYEKYETRIRGVTVRPRNRIMCWNTVSELKSCVTDASRIEVDAEYCETLDYRGRPVGEYEEPDHYLTCVGYWMEDMKSYLITYDEEDAISKYRCWVYERIAWTEFAMSRAETARCPRDQTATSSDIDGARLYLQLTEAERLYDDCPQRFDPGVDPSRKPRTLYRLDDGSG